MCKSSFLVFLQMRDHGIDCHPHIRESRRQILILCVKSFCLNLPQQSIDLVEPTDQILQDLNRIVEVLLFGQRNIGGLGVQDPNLKQFKVVLEEVVDLDVLMSHLDAVTVLVLSLRVKLNYLFTHYQAHQIPITAGFICSQQLF